MRFLDYLPWRRSRRERDLEEELASHLAMAAQERIANGEDPLSAELAARKEFGNVTLTREATRRAWGHEWVERVADVVRDVSYGIRLLRRAPAYCAVVIAVLALGIGCNVIVFSLFKALALNPLAGVAQSGDLRFVGAMTTGGHVVPLSYPDYRDLRARTFASLAGSSYQLLTIGTGVDGHRVSTELVTGNYFDTLGVRPQLGRAILPSDERPGAQRAVAVLSDALWHRAFAADPSVIGRSIHVNSQPLTVVGVADARFRGSVIGLATDLFVPITAQPLLMSQDELDFRDDRWVLAFMREPGDQSQASAKAASASAELARTYPLDDVRQRAVIVSIWKWPFGVQSFMLPAVSLMGVMATLLLLVVSANVGGLVLVRSVSRRGEIAVRLALGGRRGRVVRQLLIEALVLAVPGATAGFFLPPVVAPFIGAAAANVSVPLSFNVEPDALVVGFTLLLAAGSALLYGSPAFRLGRVDVVSMLKSDLGPHSPSRSWLRSGLVVAQIAMAVMLLVGTGLVYRSLETARQTTGGFDPRQVTWASFDVTGQLREDRSGRRFYRQLIERISTSNGVEAATASRFLPLTFIDWQSWNVLPEGYNRRRDEDLAFALNTIGPDYFRTLRIPLVAGREFDWHDDERSAPVAVINESFARRFWGTPAAAIGKRFQAGDKWNTVVGVAHDAKYARLDEAARPYFYVPFMQRDAPELTVQVRSTRPAGEVVAAIRKQAEALDPNLAVLDSGLLVTQLRAAVSIYEALARVLSIIGLLAATLGGLGIYGLVAYTVKQSAREIGIRTAIGASRQAIVARFLSRGVRLGAVGMTIGLALALMLTPAMSGLLFGVPASDRFSFAGAALAVMSTVLLAALIPAWRASNVDPAAVLRHD